MNILDLFFPRFCLECKKKGKYICAECLSKMSVAKQICPVCKRYNFGGKTHDRCASKNNLDGLVTFWNYEGVVRKAILALKYRFAYSVAEELVASLNLDIRSDDNVILLPVPLHIKRENWRGFNQATVLGKLLADKQNWQVENNLLLRLENTISQVKLDREKRLQNISGKFALNDEAKRVILSEAEGSQPVFIIFDDVWTTGSTI